MGQKSHISFFLFPFPPLFSFFRPSFSSPLPSSPQVDERLNGDGTGKILGVGGVEGWAILIVFSLVWSLFYAAQKQLGDGPAGRGKGDDSGLSL